jgi:membrane protein implicated in regulation of membrane protease activity
MRIDRLFIRLPRHPLLRVLMLIVGSVLLIGLVAMGLLVVAAAVATAALTMLVRRWLHGRGRRHTGHDVIEGEFTVMPPGPRASLPSAERAPTTRSGW